MSPFRKLYITKDSIDDPLTRQIQLKLPNLQAQIIEREEVRAIADNLRWQKDPVDSGKRTLLLTRQLGQKIEHCPGSKYALCCNYMVMNLMQGCPYDCSYCYLQNYLTNPIRHFIPTWMIS